MPKIGILEDRPDFRTSIRRSIRSHLPNGWETIDVPLLKDAEHIPAWLNNNDVQVLIADYKLNELAQNPDEAPVNYTSNEVIKFIRQMMPDYPVFILTAVPEADEQPDAASAEAVMKRTEFGRDAEVYVSRMIRAAQRFSIQFQHELAELASLSESIATGVASEQERERVKALQSLIGLEITVESAANRQESLDELSHKLQELETLKATLENELTRRL
jgi:CheY-like chemotaxis protein